MNTHRILIRPLPQLREFFISQSPLLSTAVLQVLNLLVILGWQSKHIQYLKYKSFDRLLSKVHLEHDDSKTAQSWKQKS